MAPSDKNDPNNVERIARILRDAIPNAKITSRDLAEFAPVEFRIERDRGVGLVLIDWDCLQEDQIAVTEELVRMHRMRFASGLCWHFQVGRQPTKKVIS